jgi:HopA1 effector protein family
MAASPRHEPRVRLVHEKRFSLRAGAEPELARASGDSGFVAHLAASSHGATGWDWSFRLVKTGFEWAFISDGKLSVFVDEPGQYVPAEAKPGEQVALRLPRARENLHPHRFMLVGGQGPAVVGHGFTKLFLPVSFEAAPSLVEVFASKLGDQLRFSLCVANSPHDFQRADSAVLDVGASDTPQVQKVLESFVHGHPSAFSPRGLPLGTREGPLGFPTAQGQDKGDLADGYGWRRAQEAVARGEG